MKIAIIIERFNIDLGGAERSIAQLTEQLSSSGCNVELLAATGKSASANVKLLCADVKSKRVNMDLFATRLKEYLATTNFDIIHSTLPFNFCDVYQPRGGSYKEAFLRNADSYGGLLSEFKKATHWTNLRRLKLVNAEKKLCSAKGKTIVAALSNPVKRAFISHYNLPDKRVALIRNAVKLPETILDESQVLEKRNELLAKFPAHSKKDTLFIFAANNFRLKGLKELLLALAIVTKEEKGKSARLVIAGSGKQAKYKKLIMSLGIEDNIVFLGHIGSIDTILNACDVAVLPTYYDPASRFTIEALAMQKPVITTSLNGTCDLFTDKRHGMVIDKPSNINALSEAIKYYLNRENLERAKKAIEDDSLSEQISIERHAKELIELYSQIIKDKRD